MRYKDFIYDPEDPAEIAAEPPSFDLNDPLLSERSSLEQTLSPRDPQVTAANVAQARLAEEVYDRLRVKKDDPLLTGDVELGVSAVDIHFVALTVANFGVGETWEGHRSPKLSRLKLSAATREEVVGALEDLWMDRAAWTQPVHGLVLSPPACP